MPENYMSQLMMFQHRNKKRHVSIAYQWREALGRMADFVACPSRETFDAVVLDRGYSQVMIKNFLKTLNDYERLCMETALSDNALEYAPGTLLDLEEKVGSKGPGLMQSKMKVEYLGRCVREFKDIMIGNYAAYIKKKAAYAGNAREDMEMVYYMAADKAINHFNPMKGTFKSYLDIWMRKFYGEEVARQGQSETVMDMELMAEEVVSDSVKTGQSDLSVLHGLARQLDPRGWLEKVLGA